jgi:excinuclease ABC subunit B
VAILDADKEGFLRSNRSLIQTCGRAARNINGTVILYADRVTPSMQQAIDETRRRRRIQQDHNQRHHITPASIRKAIRESFEFGSAAPPAPAATVAEDLGTYTSLEQLDPVIRKLEKQMHQAAHELDFERAAELRDRIRELQKRMVYAA